MDSPIHPATASSTVEPSAKRKRTPIADSAPPPPPGLHPTSNASSNVTQINYLVKVRGEKLRLIEGDAETFGDVLGMIDDYEGVLQRHESLAANLGAKLVGPLLLKSFEKLFDGPIKIITPSFALDQSPISWIDIIAFVRSNPHDFMLTPSSSSPGVKTCRFWIKNGQIEISEDDYRLIMTGAPDRMIPTQPIEEDESAELGTLNILEGRLALLIKKADAVASKARQLNYHLKGRKTALLSRKAASPTEAMERPFSPPGARAGTGVNGEGAKIQQQLLEQFLTLSSGSVQPASSSRRTSIAHSRPKTTTQLPPQPQPLLQTTALLPTTTNTTPTPSPFQNAFSTSPHPQQIQQIDTRRLSQPSSEDGGVESQYRVLMATKIDKLAKGDVIFPPCDRCRRLKFECTKHLTACKACTRKHARCSWKDVREGEVEFVHLQQGGMVQMGGGGYGGGGDSGGASAGIGGETGSGSGRPGELGEVLDPGLRSVSAGPGIGGGNGMVDAEEERAYREREERLNQGLRLNAEQALLAQAASSGPHSSVAAEAAAANR